MRIRFVLCIAIWVVLSLIFFSFQDEKVDTSYEQLYTNGIIDFQKEQRNLLDVISRSDPSTETGKSLIKIQLNKTRLSMKKMDIWLRYLEPLSYKKINGPLPVEWETEVFEKFEKPYRREGAGLTLASIYLDEDLVLKDSLLHLIGSSLKAVDVFTHDSITEQLKQSDHFFLANRLFILNLATIYTSGFECPDTDYSIVELKEMMKEVLLCYKQFNLSFSSCPLSKKYMDHYQTALEFVANQPNDITKFDHFTFTRDFVNPLFVLNQEMIRNYKIQSRSYVDYSLNNNCNSIFSKKLYVGQNVKGVFLRVYDPQVLNELEKVGKSLFYDPILSGNNERSCASCHKPSEYFTENGKATSLQFDKKNVLPRNSPSLLNSAFNHLIMLDGNHISLQDQAKAVITNSLELNCDEKVLLEKVMSCKEYKESFNKLIKHTPQEKEMSIKHISSALTFYYSKFSQFSSVFDKAMNKEAEAGDKIKRGYNVFMGKAACGTCHFAPHFNGVKPPYVGSEFEVLGTPSDTTYSNLSSDKGRYMVNPAFETLHAFRTGTLKNIERTAPYMHNGVFDRLEQVIEFYDNGGGAGHGLKVENQTLSSDSLHLSQDEKNDLIEFLRSLNEDIRFEPIPLTLPKSRIKELNFRKVNGTY